MPFPSLMIKLPNYLAGYVEFCSSGRVFCSYQPNWLIIRQCFFFLSLFTTDTNAGQSHRLTNCIQNLPRYNLKSSIFKHSLLFIHPFKNTTQVLRPIAHKCYISSFNLFHLVQNIAVSDFRARKNKFENWHFRPTFPHQTPAKVKSPPQGRPYKSNFPTPWAQKTESNARGFPGSISENVVWNERGRCGK